MILEVLRWPDSQEVMHEDGWFFVTAGDGEKDPLGSSAYARIVDDVDGLIDASIKNQYLYERSQVNEVSNDEGYNQYKESFERSREHMRIAKSALEFLSGHPATSLNYQFIAEKALKEIDEGNEKESV